MAELAEQRARPMEARPVEPRRIAVVPALNEERNVASVIDEIRRFDSGLEIVVVDDGSIDGTSAVAEAIGATVLRLPINLGIGGAVQTGYRYALENAFELAVQIDADGQHDPAELPKVIAPIVAGEADLVIGSRFMRASGYRTTRLRRLGIRVFARIVSLLVGQPLTDTSSSFRAINRSGLQVFSVDYPHGFLESVEATVIAMKYGLRIKEVPVTMRERAHGSSTLTTTLSFFYAAKVLVALIVTLFRRPLLPMEEDT